jgi:SPP1 gp7 family putative phage head morphogenesis protein
MAVPIKKSKEDWAKQFNFSGSLKGTPLHYNFATSSKMQAELTKLVRQMTEQVEKELERFFRGELSEEYFSTDASLASQARILSNKLTKKFNKIFGEKSKVIVERNIKRTNKTSASSTHNSLKELSGLSLKTSAITPRMKDVMKAASVEGASLIKSISTQYLDGVGQAVMRSIVSGNGMADLKPFLMKHKGVTERRAELIARDQTSKLYSALNKERMVDAGVKKFQWIHSHGGKEPRELHLQLDGEIFSYDDLPVIDEKTGERGLPGQLINCKCIARPIVTFEDGSEQDDRKED